MLQNFKENDKNTASTEAWAFKGFTAKYGTSVARLRPWLPREIISSIAPRPQGLRRKLKSRVFRRLVIWDQAWASKSFFSLAARQTRTCRLQYHFALPFCTKFMHGLHYWLHSEKLPQQSSQPLESLSSCTSSRVYQTCDDANIFYLEPRRDWGLRSPRSLQYRDAVEVYTATVVLFDRQWLEAKGVITWPYISFFV